MIRTVVAVFAWVVLAVAADAAKDAAPVEVLRGTVDVEAVESDVEVGFVRTDGGASVLRGDRFWIGQLRDPQLEGRAWEVEARAAGDGAYDIVVAYTIKDGERYRVTYYCDICHIRTHDPGRCMCCQEDTVLQELPAEEFGTL